MKIRPWDDQILNVAAKFQKCKNKRVIRFLAFIIMMFYCGLMVHITDTRTQKVASYTSADITETVLAQKRC